MNGSPVKKNYIVDTNVLLENPLSLLSLKNGSDNNIYIPYHVLMELDRLKALPQHRHVVSRIIEIMLAHKDEFIFLPGADGQSPFIRESADSYILEEVEKLRQTVPDPILVTNDRILRLRAFMSDIQSEELRDSRPFESESQLYSGFVDEQEPKVPNCFYWKEGRPVFCGADGEKPISYTLDVWNVRPRTVYQNLALDLMLNPAIDLVTIQSEAGHGKTFLALAAALYLTLERKLFDKIFVVKPTIEIGAKLGYLPGDLNDKLEPYVKYMSDLILKLHDLRPANRIFAGSGGEESVRYNPKKFEILPLGYIRGMNIEKSFVIIDETQNLSRLEIRALLTRMGEGVKCVCLGDTSQVDNPYLNASNNGLNWIVKKFKGFGSYAHMVLKGDKSRGPITDMALKSKL